MRKLLTALTSLLLALTPAAAVPPTGPERLFTARDLFSLEVATDPQIAPDGRSIAYVRRSGDIMTDRFRPAIWLIDSASGRQMPLVAGTGAHSSPRWSPTGDRLASVSTAEGGQACTASSFRYRWMSAAKLLAVS